MYILLSLLSMPDRKEENMSYVRCGCVDNHFKQVFRDIKKEGLLPLNPLSLIPTGRIVARVGCQWSTKHGENHIS